MPEDFEFPGKIVVEDFVLKDIMENSLRCLRSKNRQTEEVQQFLRDNLPRSSPDDYTVETVAKKPTKRPRTEGNIAQHEPCEASSSSNVQPVEPHVNDEEMLDVK